MAFELIMKVISMGSFAALKICGRLNCSPLNMAQYKLQSSLATAICVGRREKPNMTAVQWSK